MRRNLIAILSLLFFSCLFAVPVGAFDLSQCAPFPAETTEFTLIAEDNIIFEPQSLQSPPRVIQGNVLVTSLHPAGGTFNNTGIGFVRVGSNTKIDGTVIADVLFLPDGGAHDHTLHREHDRRDIPRAAEPVDCFPGVVPRLRLQRPTPLASAPSPPASVALIRW